MLLMIIIAASIYSLGTAYDIEQTLKGLKMGVGVERNTFLIGSHPTELAMILRETAVLTIMMALGVFVHPVLFISSAIAGGLKHLVGGLRWRVLINGGTLKPLNSVWRQFLGF